MEAQIFHTSDDARNWRAVEYVSRKADTPFDYRAMFGDAFISDDYFSVVVVGKESGCPVFRCVSATTDTRRSAEVYLPFADPRIVEKMMSEKRGPAIFSGFSREPFRRHRFLRSIKEYRGVSQGRSRACSTAILRLRNEEISRTRGIGVRIGTRSWDFSLFGLRLL